jgi:site-specific recombinase XerD
MDSIRQQASTQATYRRDLHRFFAAWQQQGHEATIDLVTPPLVRKYLGDRRERGTSARTTARMLATLGAFDLWLCLEGLRSARMLADMGTPRVPRSLPHSLSQQDIDKLLQQPSRTSPIGLRDLAMLEVLYGSGLRVAELVSLPMRAIHFLDGWLKIRGKGGSERIVPMGSRRLLRSRSISGSPVQGCWASAGTALMCSLALALDP